ncbi:MAG: TraB family protein [Candidatus Altiarchaeales archaeon]|nr:MAG: TraB family protein [Candidatus Altiarchaeales archaeon]
MLEEVIKICIGDREIFLIGTAHVSEKSVKLVKETIERVNPDIVAVELCKQRCDAILNNKKWDETEIDRVIKEGKIYLFLMQLMLTNFQRKIGDELGIKPGSEMLEAIKIAKEKNIEIALVDRDIKISMKRLFNRISLVEKFKLFYGLISEVSEEESVNELMERLKDKDILTKMIEDMGKEIPSFKEVLLDERDRYIANKIMNIDAKRIVAVLGAGHVDGIKNIIESGDTKSKNEIRSLEEIPESKSALKYLGYFIPILIFSLIIIGFLSKGEAFLVKSIWKWVLINGSLSALGVLMAFGHPLSAITAFIAAPITSLNPLLAAGWFAGLTEAKMRKPKVKDFEDLLRLDSIGDYWKNGVTRILLVIVFANLGSCIGTYIAGFSIFMDIV